MFSNLMFALNATVPIFLLILLGMLLRRLGVVEIGFAEKLNKFTFLIPLPVLVFNNLATVSIEEAWDGKFVLFCFTATLISIGISFLISQLFEREIRGEFIQASYRSSAALFGIAFIQNIYGTSGFGPLMIIGSVPLYNIMAVIVLSVFSPENGGKKISAALIKKTLIGIIKNPILIGIVIGLVWSLLGIPLTGILYKTTNSIGSMATPLGLIAMGATFRMDQAITKIRPTLTATFLKLIGFCMIFLPVAIWMGYRTEKLVAILVMLGSTTTVSSFVMARSMGNEGVVTSGTVILTSILSAFSLTMWLFILKSAGVL